MSVRRRSAPLVALAWGLALASSSATAGDPPVRAFDPGRYFDGGAGAATEIRASSLILDRGRQQLIYEGDVVVRRGATRLECARLTLRYEEDQSIDSGLCEGDARFTEGARRARADAARFDRARDRVTLTGAVDVEDGVNRVRGERVELELDTERMSVWGDETELACTRFQGDPEPATGRAAAKTPTAAASGPVPPTDEAGGLHGMERLWGSAEGPVEVCARRAVLENRDGRVLYVGKVEAVQGDARLRCDELELRYGADRAVETGSCRGGAELVRGSVTATARDARLDGVRQTITLTDSVRVFEEGAEVQATRAVVLLEEDRVVMEGTGEQPVKTVVEAEATAEAAGGTTATERERPPREGTRIDDPFGILPTGDAGAVPDPLRVRSFWLQAKRGTCNGLYRGEVLARHRGVTMESDELEVWCDEQTNELTEIEARDHVRISNVEGVATADRAHYSASTQRMILTGKDVIFERAGQAHLRCSEMIFDRGTNQMWCRGKRASDRTILKLNTEGGGDLPTGGILK